MTRQRIATYSVQSKDNLGQYVSMSIMICLYELTSVTWIVLRAECSTFVSVSSRPWEAALPVHTNDCSNVVQKLRSASDRARYTQNSTHLCQVLLQNESSVIVDLGRDTLDSATTSKTARDVISSGVDVDEEVFLPDSALGHTEEIVTEYLPIVICQTKVDKEKSCGFSTYWCRFGPPRPVEEVRPKPRPARLGTSFPFPGMWVDWSMLMLCAKQICCYEHSRSTR